MIKLIFEEPITYKDGEYKEGQIWIYKNPTEDEAQDVIDICGEARFLVDGDDYYIAPAYYFVHSELARYLYSYTKHNLSDYDFACVIDFDRDEICIGFKYNTNNINVDSDNKDKDIAQLIPVLKKMIECELASDYTKIINISGAILSTVKELLE